MLEFPPIDPELMKAPAIQRAGALVISHLIGIADQAGEGRQNANACRCFADIFPSILFYGLCRGVARRKKTPSDIQIVQGKSRPVAGGFGWNHDNLVPLPETITDK